MLLYNVLPSKKEKSLLKIITGTSRVVQRLKHYLPMQGEQVQFLVGEVRPHTPYSQKNENMEQKQYCNQYNKD